MSWNAKPSGSYDINSTEGQENARLMASIMVNDFGFTLESACGAIANSIWEGGLNPWRWQEDKYPPPSGKEEVWGCGLFGFTSYRRYLTMQGSNLMNTSVTIVKPNASPEVGTQQVTIMANGTWGWIPYGWRWGDNYLDQKAIWQRVATEYGTNNRISLEQYKTINNAYDACMAFLCCFEGPGEPNYYSRESSVEAVWNVISDGPLPPPPTPPTPSKRRKMPLWMMVRRL